MRIVVDASTFADLRSGAARRSIEVFARVVARSEEDDFFFLLHPNVIGAYRDRMPRARLIAWRAGRAGPIARALRHVRAVRRLTRELRADLVHQESRPYALPSRTIPTIHDLRDLDEAIPSSRLRVTLLTRHLKRVLPRVPLLVTVSHWTAREIERRLGVEPERIRVIENGVDASAYQSAIPERDDAVLAARALHRAPYLLVVGHREPRKDIPFAIRVLQAALEHHPRLLLVVVGRRVAAYREPEITAARLRVADRVRFLDDVDHDELAALYRRSCCLLHPSRHEGFGMTILEAMAARTPVVCPNDGPYPEVAGERALVPRDDVRAWADEVSRLLVDPAWRERAVAAGTERVARYDWDTAARKMIAVHTEWAARLSFERTKTDPDGRR